MNDFPRTVDEITPIWLTQVLRDSGAVRNARVESFDASSIGGEEGITTDIVRLGLNYDVDEGEAPKAVVAKLPRADIPANPVIAAFSEREIQFYNQLASDSGLNTPKLFASKMDATDNSFILLVEDLSHLRSVDIIDGCAFEDTRAALNSVAVMHAKWWNNPSLAGHSWLSNNPIPISAELAQTRFLDGFDQFLEFAGDRVPDGVEAIGRTLGPKIPNVIDSLASTPVTLVHGDYHASNLFFSVAGGETSKPVAFDWQMAGRLKAANDVGFFMLQSLTTQERRQHEKQLLDEYHSVLIDHGVTNYSYDELWTDVRLAVLPRFVARVNITFSVAAKLLESEEGRRMVEAYLQRFQILVDWDCGEVIPK